MIVSDLGNDRYIEVVYDSLIKECRHSHSPVAFFRFIEAVLKVVSILIKTNVLVGVHGS